MSTRKKLNQSILSVRDFKDGVAGVIGETAYLTNFDGEKVLSRYGSPLMTFELKDEATGVFQKFWLDGGLRGVLKMAKVQPGMNILIVHTGEKEIDSGVVQTYDIFSNE